MLGEVAAPNYTLKNQTLTRSGQQTTLNTYAADKLYIEYQQNEWGIIPKLTIANNYLKRRFHWEIGCSYFLTFSKKAGINIYQEDKGGNNPNQLNTSLIKLNNNDIYTTFNQNKIEMTPFHFNNLYIGATIGYTFHFPLSRR